MSNQNERNNIENNRLNYISSHIQKPQPLSRGRCGHRAYVFASGRVEGTILESVQASPGFYRRLENNVFR